MTTITGDDWITTAAASKLAGYHAVHLRRLLVTGKIVGQKFGPTWMVSRTSLLAYVRRQQKELQKRGPKTAA